MERIITFLITYALEVDEEEILPNLLGRAVYNRNL